MTTITGSLVDVVGSTTSGRIEVWATAPRKDGNDTVGTGVGQILVVNGVVQPIDVSPGPCSFYISIGTWIQLIEGAVVPEQASVDFWDVIESTVDYAPAVVSQVRADRLAAEAARSEAVAAAASVAGDEYFYHSLVGASSFASRSSTGHPLTWTQNPSNSGAVGTLTGGNRQAFYANPGVAPSAVYLAATLQHRPVWGRMRFAFLAGSAAGGTACIAVPSKASIAAPLDMALHLRTTRTGFAAGLWDNGAEVVKQSGSYTSILPAGSSEPIEYSLSFAFVEGPNAGVRDTLIYRTPDGFVRGGITDPRFATLGGSYIFGETYEQSASDDVVAGISLEAGTRIPPGLI